MCELENGIISTSKSREVVHELLTDLDIEPYTKIGWPRIYHFPLAEPVSNAQETWAAQILQNKPPTLCDTIHTSVGVLYHCYINPSVVIEGDVTVKIGNPGHQISRNFCLWDQTPEQISAIQDLVTRVSEKVM